MKRLIPLALLTALTGCPNPGAPDAIIHAHQVGACNGGQSQSGMPSFYYNAGPQAAYVIFAIDSIDNTQLTSGWTIDPTNFFVNSGIKDSFDPGLMIYAKKLGPFALISTAMPAGAPYNFFGAGYGAMIVQTSAQDGASEAATTKYDLLYTPTGPGVIIELGPLASTAYTPNCADVTLQ